MNKTWQPLFNELPNSLQKLVQKLVEELAPTQVILFGSRARGTHRENSDFDIALVGVEENSKWTQFLINMDEEAWSLYPMDLVLLESLSEDYKKNIETEGKVIYG